MKLIEQVEAGIENMSVPELVVELNRLEQHPDFDREAQVFDRLEQITVSGEVYFHKDGYWTYHADI